MRHGSDFIDRQFRYAPQHRSEQKRQQQLAVLTSQAGILKALPPCIDKAEALISPIEFVTRFNDAFYMHEQLAVSDLLVSIWCLSGEAAWTYTVEWKGGDLLCRIFKFSQVHLRNIH